MIRFRLFLLLIFGVSQIICGQREVSESERQLIVYLSRTQNTKVVAEIIRECVGGKLVALELQEPYPENYNAIVRQVQQENESGYLPPLKTMVDLSNTDTLYIGFPTWGMQLPPPVKSFIASNSLAGKVIIPFNTNAGYGVGSGFTQIKAGCPDSKVLEGFSVKGGLERDGIFLTIHGERRKEVAGLVQKWLKKLNVLKDSK